MCSDWVVGCPGVEAVPERLPAGMDHHMDRCRTKCIDVSSDPMSPICELTLDGSFISIQEPSMSRPVSGS